MKRIDRHPCREDTDYHAVDNWLERGTIPKKDLKTLQFQTCLASSVVDAYLSYVQTWFDGHADRDPFDTKVCVMDTDWFNSVYNCKYTSNILDLLQLYLFIYYYF
jgi:hypothetical protein